MEHELIALITFYLIVLSISPISIYSVITLAILCQYMICEGRPDIKQTYRPVTLS